MKKLAFPQGRVNHLWMRHPFYSPNNPIHYQLSACGEIVALGYLVENPTLRLCGKCERSKKRRRDD